MVCMRWQYVKKNEKTKACKTQMVELGNINNRSNFGQKFVIVLDNDHKIVSKIGATKIKNPL